MGAGTSTGDAFATGGSEGASAGSVCRGGGVWGSVGTGAGMFGSVGSIKDCHNNGRFILVLHHYFPLLLFL